MAVVDLANLVPDTLPRHKGAFFVRMWRGVAVAQKWPVKRGPPQNWNTYWNSTNFGYAGRMAANSEPMQYETARHQTAGTHWLPRDLLTKAAFGSAYEVYLPDGTLCAVTPKGPPPEVLPEIWQTSAQAALVTNDPGWAGYTLRQRILSTAILNSNGPKIRVTFRSSAITSAATLAAAYVGVGAASGDTYDFDGPPVPLLFGGAASVSIPQNMQATSDGTLFTLPPGRNLVVSMFFGSPTALISKAAQTGWQAYYKFGNDAATVNATGYTTWQAATCVTQVEQTLP